MIKCSAERQLTALRIRPVISFGNCLATFWRSMTRAICRCASLILLSLFTAFLSGCSTVSAIDDVMLPYTTVRTVVMANIPMGVRRESANGRSLTSNYFGTNSIDDDAGEGPNRAYAEIVILGSSRPYKITIRVIREQRTKKSRSFVVVGDDKKLTKDLATRLKEALADRREDRNLIDDFRAF